MGPTWWRYLCIALFLSNFWSFCYLDFMMLLLSSCILSLRLRSFCWFLCCLLERLEEGIIQLEKLVWEIIALGNCEIEFV